MRGIGGPDSLQYSEQEWYLTRYGSASGLLRFYLRHEQWNAALSQLLQRQLDPELFIDSILLPAYRSNAQDRLKAEMVAMDSSLELFKVCFMLLDDLFVFILTTALTVIL